MRKDQIGIQLYTLRELAAQSYVDMLRTVAEMGYRGVEFAGFGELTASSVKQELDRLNLKALSAHVGEGSFMGDIDAVISDMQTVEAPWVIIPSMNFGELVDAPFDWGTFGQLTPTEISERYTLNEQSAIAFCERLNGYAKKIEAAGLSFGYHNHHFEFLFRTADGKTMFEVMIENTEPAVHVELDVFWAAVGADDPAGLLRRHKDRIRLVHLKDASELLPGKDVPFGTGLLDWPPILSAAEEAGVVWYITEQDNPNPDDPARDAATSLRNAEAMCTE